MAEQPASHIGDTGDLLAQHEQRGGADPVTAPVSADSRSYVEPYRGARPVQPTEDDEDDDAAGGQ